MVRGHRQVLEGLVAVFLFAGCSDEGVLDSEVRSARGQRARVIDSSPGQSDDLKKTGDARGILQQGAANTTTTHTRPSGSALAGGVVPAGSPDVDPDLDETCAPDDCDEPEPSRKRTRHAIRIHDDAEEAPARALPPPGWIDNAWCAQTYGPGWIATRGRCVQPVRASVDTAACEARYGAGYGFLAGHGCVRITQPESHDPDAAEAIDCSELGASFEPHGDSCFDRLTLVIGPEADRECRARHSEHPDFIFVPGRGRALGARSMPEPASCRSDHGEDAMWLEGWGCVANDLVETSAEDYCPRLLGIPEAQHVPDWGCVAPSRLAEDNARCETRRSAAGAVFLPPFDCVAPMPAEDCLYDEQHLDGLGCVPLRDMTAPEVSCRLLRGPEARFSTKLWGCALLTRQSDDCAKTFGAEGWRYRHRDGRCVRTATITDTAGCRSAFPGQATIVFDRGEGRCVVPKAVTRPPAICPPPVTGGSTVASGCAAIDPQSVTAEECQALGTYVRMPGAGCLSQRELERRNAHCRILGPQSFFSLATGDCTRVGAPPLATGTCESALGGAFQTIAGRCHSPADLASRGADCHALGAGFAYSDTQGCRLITRASEAVCRSFGEGRYRFDVATASCQLDAMAAPRTLASDADCQEGVGWNSLFDSGRGICRPRLDVLCESDPDQDFCPSARSCPLGERGRYAYDSTSGYWSLHCAEPAANRFTGLAAAGDQTCLEELGAHPVRCVGRNAQRELDPHGAPGLFLPTSLPGASAIDDMAARDGRLLWLQEGQAFSRGVGGAQEIMVRGVEAPLVRAAFTNRHLCLLTSDHRVFCRRVGVQSFQRLALPKPVVDLAAAGERLCAIAGPDLKVHCAVDSAGPDPLPGADALALASDQAELAMSDSQICARKTSGAVSCLDLTDPNAEERVINLGAAASQLAVAGADACALLADGTVKCWQGGAATALAVTGVTHLAAGRAHFCALKDSLEVHCWGDGRAGQLFAVLPQPTQAAPVLTWSQGTVLPAPDPVTPYFFRGQPLRHQKSRKSLTMSQTPGAEDCGFAALLADEQIPPIPHFMQPQTAITAKAWASDGAALRAGGLEVALYRDHQGASDAVPVRRYLRQCASGFGYHVTPALTLHVHHDTEGGAALRLERSLAPEGTGFEALTIDSSPALVLRVPDTNSANDRFLADLAPVGPAPPPQVVAPAPSPRTGNEPQTPNPDPESPDESADQIAVERQAAETARTAATAAVALAATALVDINGRDHFGLPVQQTLSDAQSEVATGNGQFDAENYVAAKASFDEGKRLSDEVVALAGQVWGRILTAARTRVNRALSSIRSLLPSLAPPNRASYQSSLDAYESQVVTAEAEATAGDERSAAGQLDAISVQAEGLSNQLEAEATQHAFHTRVHFPFTLLNEQVGYVQTHGQAVLGQAPTVPSMGPLNALWQAAYRAATPVPNNAEEKIVAFEGALQAFNASFAPVFHHMKGVDLGRDGNALDTHLASYRSIASSLGGFSGPEVDSVHDEITIIALALNEGRAHLQARRYSEANVRFNEGMMVRPDPAAHCQAVYNTLEAQRIQQEQLRQQQNAAAEQPARALIVHLAPLLPPINATLSALAITGNVSAVQSQVAAAQGKLTQAQTAIADSNFLHAHSLAMDAQGTVVSLNTGGLMALIRSQLNADYQELSNFVTGPQTHGGRTFLQMKSLASGWASAAATEAVRLGGEIDSHWSAIGRTRIAPLIEGYPDILQDRKDFLEQFDQALAIEDAAAAAALAAAQAKATARTAADRVRLLAVEKIDELADLIADVDAIATGHTAGMTAKKTVAEGRLAQGDTQYILDTAAGYRAAEIEFTDVFTPLQEGRDLFDAAEAAAEAAVAAAEAAAQAQQRAALTTANTMNLMIRQWGDMVDPGTGNVIGLAIATEAGVVRIWNTTLRAQLESVVRASNGYETCGATSERNFVAASNRCSNGDPRKRIVITPGMTTGGTVVTGNTITAGRYAAHSRAFVLDGITPKLRAFSQGAHGTATPGMEMAVAIAFTHDNQRQAYKVVTGIDGSGNMNRVLYLSRFSTVYKADRHETFRTQVGLQRRHRTLWFETPQGYVNTFDGRYLCRSGEPNLHHSAALTGEVGTGPNCQWTVGAGFTIWRFTDIDNQNYGAALSGIEDL